MIVLQAAAFVLVAAGATVVVLTRDPLRQVFAFAVYGIFLTVLFVLLQAPDVALSELTIGTAALPLILLVTLAKLRESKHE